MLLPGKGKGRTEDAAQVVVGLAVTADVRCKPVAGRVALMGCGIAKVEEKVWVGTLEEGNRGPVEPVDVGMVLSTRNTCSGAGAGIIVSCWSLLRSKADNGRPPIIQAMSSLCCDSLLSLTSLLSLSSLAVVVATGTGAAT